MTKTVNVYEAKTRLSALLAEAESGADIVIARHGRPVVRLVLVGARQADRTPGAWRGRIRIAEDFDSVDDEAWYGNGS